MNTVLTHAAVIAAAMMAALALLDVVHERFEHHWARFWFDFPILLAFEYALLYLLH